MDVESSLALIANDCGSHLSLPSSRDVIYVISLPLRRLKNPLVSLVDLAAGYLHFGLHRPDQGWTHREWAPRAQSVALVGGFNHWNDQTHPLYKN